MALQTQDCPRAILPASQTEQTCEVSFRNVRRLVLIHSDGAVPFTGVDAAAQVTAIETQSNWTTAIALPTVDRLFLTPRARGSNSTPGGEQFETREDQSRSLVAIDPSTLTLKLYGLSAAQEKACKDAINGNGYKFGFILADGNFLGYDVESANVPGTAGSKDPFMPVEAGVFKDRSFANQATDFNEIVLSYEYGTIENWRIYNTSAFGLTI